jgi:hypothetical protein
MDALNIGHEFAPWQVKDFSVRLRGEITRLARTQDCTVADWLHAHFERYGLGGVHVDQVKITEVKPDAGRYVGPTEEERLLQLVQAGARFAECRDQLPKVVAAALARRIREVAQGQGAPSKVSALPHDTAPEHGLPMARLTEESPVA